MLRRVDVHGLRFATPWVIALVAYSGAHFSSTVNPRLPMAGEGWSGLPGDPIVSYSSDDAARAKAFRGVVDSGATAMVRIPFCRPRVSMVGRLGPAGPTSAMMHRPARRWLPKLRCGPGLRLMALCSQHCVNAGKEDQDNPARLRTLMPHHAKWAWSGAVERFALQDWAVLRHQSSPEWRLCSGPGAWTVLQGHPAGSANSRQPRPECVFWPRRMRCH